MVEQWEVPGIARLYDETRMRYVIDDAGIEIFTEKLSEENHRKLFVYIKNIGFSNTGKFSENPTEHYTSYFVNLYTGYWYIKIYISTEEDVKLWNVNKENIETRYRGLLNQTITTAQEQDQKRENHKIEQQRLMGMLK